MSKVLFQNSDYIEPIKHKDSSTVVVVRRKESEGKLREEDGLLLFSGSENPLVYQRKYQQRFYCTFDFRWYPFDTQECSIELANFDTLKVFFCRKLRISFTSICQGFLSMEAGRMEYVGERELLQYSVKEWRMEKTGDNVVKAVLKVSFLA